MSSESCQTRTERAAHSFRKICTALGLSTVDDDGAAEDAAPVFRPPAPRTSAAAKGDYFPRRMATAPTFPPPASIDQ